MKLRLNSQSRGFALVVGLALIVVLLALALAFASNISSNQLRMESDIAGERAYQLAQNANTATIDKVWTDFKAQPSKQRIPWLGGEDSNNNGKLDKGEDANHNGIMDPPHATDYQDQAWVQVDPGSILTRIKILSMQPQEWVLVRFTTWGRVKDSYKSFDVTRKVQRVVRFSLRPPGIFDFAYFSSNHIAINGTALTVNGNVGSNGDMTLTNNPVIQGNVYVTADPSAGTDGKVHGGSKHDDLNHYITSLTLNPLLPPTNPTAPSEDKNNNGILEKGEDTNRNGILDTYQYDLGYSGNPTVLQQQNPIAVPLLADLSLYKGYADTFERPANPAIADDGGTGGVVKQLKAPGLDPTLAYNYNILIDRSYGYSGETGLSTSLSNGSNGNGNGNGNSYGNGLSGSVSYDTLSPIDATNLWRNGNVALIGTQEQPLVISGPVVISNDLVIKGTVTGQGTFFVGRNVHVVGDIVYKNAPQWYPNDTKFDQTAATNQTKDLVGFAARGNIVLGDYSQMSSSTDQWGVLKKYITPPSIFAQDVLNPGDDLIGYGDGKEGINAQGQKIYGKFNGDYTALDGGTRYLNNGEVPSSGNRSYLQSSFSDQYISNNATKPKMIQGVFFAGHLISGRADNLTVFGSIFAHDDGILSDKTMNIIYDVRISKKAPQTYVRLNLPCIAYENLVYWKDIQADDPTPASPDW